LKNKRVNQDTSFGPQKNRYKRLLYANLWPVKTDTDECPKQKVLKNNIDPNHIMADVLI